MALLVGASFLRGTALTVADIPVAIHLVGCKKLVKEVSLIQDLVVMSYLK